MRMDTIKRTCADFSFVVLTNKMWRIEHPRKLSFGVIDITTVESLKLVHGGSTFVVFFGSPPPSIYIVYRLI